MQKSLKYCHNNKKYILLSKITLNLKYDQCEQKMMKFFEGPAKIYTDNVWSDKSHLKPYNNDFEIFNVFQGRNFDRHLIWRFS